MSIVEQIQRMGADQDRPRGDQPPKPASPFCVADVAVDRPDGRKRMVTYIYIGRPSYVIYEADAQVFVQWDDDKDKASEQIKMVMELRPLCRKLEYLADGFRCAKLYRQQIALALQTALEGKLEVGRATLTQEIANATEERTRLGREYYLAGAGGVSLLLAALLIWIGGSLSNSAPAITESLLSAAGGAIGALFSIAIAIRSRTVAVDYDMTANLVDGLLRVGIGVIAGFALNNAVRIE